MPGRRARKSIDFREISDDSDEAMNFSDTEKTGGTDTSNVEKEKDEDGDEEEAEDEFTVEAILNKRVMGGVTKYLIKWEGFDDNYNTWEPEGNLDCGEILEEFERTWKEKRSGKAKAGKAGPKSMGVASSTSKYTNPTPSTSATATATVFEGHAIEGDDLDHFDDEGKKSTPLQLNKKCKRMDLRPRVEGKVYGIDRGLDPRHIVGTIVNSKGRRFFLVVWCENDEEGDMVPVEEFCDKFPEFAMSYFEGHRVWLPSPDYCDEDDGALAVTNTTDTSVIPAAATVE